MKNDHKRFYYHVNDENLNTFGAQFGNRIIHSSLTHIDKKRVQSDLSLKAVLRGRETYRLDGHTYEVHAGQFLLVNKAQEVDIHFQSKEPTVGLCVYLDPALVSQSYQYHASGADAALENPDQPASAEFLDTRYEFSDNEAGRALERLAQHLPATPDAWQDTDPQLFAWIADQLVLSQRNFISQSQKLKAEKSSTRRELYRRLLIARELIDSRFREDIDLEEISRASAMSLYHMLRNFREAFGVTPHQYLMQRRLEHAKELLQRGGIRVTDVAQQSGFGDLHNFSKAFRKRFGTSPRAFTREAV